MHICEERVTLAGLQKNNFIPSTGGILDVGLITELLCGIETWAAKATHVTSFNGKIFKLWPPRPRMGQSRLLSSPPCPRMALDLWSWKFVPPVRKNPCLPLDGPSLHPLWKLRDSCIGIGSTGNHSARIASFYISFWRLVKAACAAKWSSFLTFFSFLILIWRFFFSHLISWNGKMHFLF